jgi:hypothetical protein
VKSDPIIEINGLPNKINLFLDFSSFFCNCKEH